MTTSTTTYAVPAYVAATDDTESTWSDTVADAAVAAYGTADKAGKAAIRTAWKKAQDAAIRDLDTVRIAFTRDLLDRLVTVRNLDKVDPLVAYRVRFEALRDAATAVREAYIEQALATDSDLSHDAVTMAFDNVTLDEEAVKAVSAMTSKLVTVPNGTRRDGPNRSITGHILAVLQAAPAGAVLTASQIKAQGSDHYGPTEASAGAIGAAWDRGSDDTDKAGNAIDGVSYVKNTDGHKAFTLS